MLNQLITFLDSSPSCYHGVGSLARPLAAEGYTALGEPDHWD